MRFLVLLSLYFSASLALQLNGSYVPDEQWFESVVLGKVLPTFQTHGLFGTFFQTKAHLGYGSIFWYTYGLIAYATRNWVSPFIPLRIFLICGVTFAWALFYSVAGKLNQKRVELLFLLFLTFPVAWWTGKVAGPDLMCSFLILAGSALLLPARSLLNCFAIFILGVAAGVKMTALPPALIVCLWAISKEQLGRAWVGWSSRLWAAFAKGMWLPIGVIFGNIALLFPDYNSTESSIFKFQFELERLREMWIGNRFEWDGVLSGGLTSWSLSLVALPLLISFLAFARSKASLSLLGSTLILTSLCFLKAGPLYGWYWFPTIFAFPIFLWNAHWDSTGVAKIAMPLIIAVNFLTQLPQIYEQIESRWIQRVQAKDFPDAHRCIEALYGKHSHFAEVIQLTEPQFNFLDAINADDKSAAFSAYVKLASLATELPSHDHAAPLLLVWSKRLATRNNGTINKILKATEAHPSLTLKRIDACMSFSTAEIIFKNQNSQ